MFGEKGLIDFDYLWHLTRSIETPIQLEKLSGGMARNSVPASADFVLRTENAEAVANEIKAEAEKMGYDAEVNTDNCFVNVHVKGIGCHAMVPERGINAVSRAMHLLSALGEKLDCPATMTYLRRTASSGFDITQAVKLKEIEENPKKATELIQPIDAFFKEYTQVDLTEEKWLKVKNGAGISLETNAKKVALRYNKKVKAIYEKKGKLYRPSLMLLQNE